MRLLLDENLSRRIVPFLEQDFPGSTQVALIGMERSSDEAVWQYARDEGFCMVTRDADFYDLSLLRGSPPKVIWLKGRNLSKAAVLQLLLAYRESIRDLLSAPDLDCLELY